MFWVTACSSSSDGDLHSITPRGIPFTNKTISGRIVFFERTRSTTNSGTA